VREYRRVDLSPDFRIDGDAEAEVFFPELESLLAGVADRFFGIDGRGFVEGVEDAFDDLGEFLLTGERAGVDGEKYLRDAGFA